MLHWIQDRIPHIMVATIGVGILTVVAWSVHQASLDSFGIVVDKSWRQAYWISPIQSGDVYTPGHFSPEKFTITLENGKYLNLPESTWQTISIGDYFGEQQ